MLKSFDESIISVRKTSEVVEQDVVVSPAVAEEANVDDSNDIQ